MKDNKIECYKCIHFEELYDSDDYGPCFVCSKKHEIDYTGYSWDMDHFPVEGDCEDFEEEKDGK